MEQGTLEEVLEVEKEIEKLLDGETAKAQQWLEQRKKKIEEERQSAITELEASVARSKDSARTSVEARASRIVDQSKAVACRVDAMSDDRLNQFVWRHLAIILPESVRDH
jgi:F0F1-type ATP synthase membrane subunit b/b'